MVVEWLSSHSPVIDLLISSFNAVGTFYAWWGLITGFGFIFSMLIFCVGYFLHIPAPSPELVEAIVGKDPSLIKDNEAYTMKTVAHRGAGLDAPENSLAAFKMCKDNGCDAIEFDVTLTKDEVPVVFHDKTLERMADVNVTIEDQEWSNLCDIDISVKHLYKDRFTKTNIPTLEQTVTQLLASGQRMFIDIKDNNMKFVKIIHELFKLHPDLYSRAVVTSFYPNIIYFIRKGNPKIVCSMAWRPHPFAYSSYNFPQGVGEKRSNVWYKHYLLRLCDSLHEWALSKFTYYILGLSIILLHKDAVSAKSVLEWRKRGVRVMVWTVNSPAEKMYFARALKLTYLTDTLTGEGTTHHPSL